MNKLEQNIQQGFAALLNQIEPQSDHQNKEDAIINLLSGFFEYSEVNYKTLKKIISVTTSEANKMIKEHRETYPRDVIKKTWVEGFWRPTYTKDVWPTDQS